MDYMSDFYRSKLDVSKDEACEFVLDCPIKMLTNSQQQELESEVNEGEVMQALMQLQAEKAPGPNGFPIEIYQRLSGKLIKPLTDM